MNPSHELVREHIQAGGRGCVLESGMTGQMITLYDHGAHIPLLPAHLIPATLDGRAMHNVGNAMFAAAMAFSMGMKLESIRHGLQTFDTTFFQAPGRGNVFDEHPFKVILDYGHNAAAVQAMVHFVERLGAAGRRIVVLSAPGDRRDEDIAQSARATAGYFDRYICRRDDNLRGRGPEEVPQLLHDALIEAGVPPDDVEVIPDEREALHVALSECRAGDLLLFFGDDITRCWEQIVNFHPVDVERRTVRRPIEGPGATVAPDQSAAPRPFVRDTRGVRLAREAEGED
jgi:cyanophycin synthetase